MGSLNGFNSAVIFNFASMTHFRKMALNSSLKLLLETDFWENFSAYHQELGASALQLDLPGRVWPFDLKFSKI